MRSINETLSNFNISAQMLSTKDDIGYLMVQLDVTEGDRKSVNEVRSNILKLDTIIKRNSRVIYNPGS